MVTITTLAATLERLTRLAHQPSSPHLEVYSLRAYVHLWLDVYDRTLSPDGSRERFQSVFCGNHGGPQLQSASAVERLRLLCHALKCAAYEPELTYGWAFRIGLSAPAGSGEYFSTQALWYNHCRLKLNGAMMSLSNL